MAAVQTSWTRDFLLYPSESAFADMSNMQHSDMYGNYQNDHGNMPHNYDDMHPVSGAPFYSTPSFVLDGAKDIHDGTARMPARMPPHHYTPSDSPSTSVTQAFDPSGSTYSHPSGASAASSSMGSPYPAPGGNIVAHDSWMDSSTLGMASEYASATFGTSSAELDSSYGAFVGESPKSKPAQRPLPSSVRGESHAASLRRSIVSSPKSSPSLLSVPAPSRGSPNASSPPTHPIPSGPTIDSIIEEANRASRNASPAASVGSHHVSPSARRLPSVSHFQTPSVPASASPLHVSRPHSPSTRPGAVRRPSAPQPMPAPMPFHPASRATIAESVFHSVSQSPQQSTRAYTHPSARMHASSGSSGALTSAFPSPFFIQSNGRFVPPLESTYPNLISPFADPSMAMAMPGGPLGNFFGAPGSPVPSNASSESHHVIGPAVRHRSPSGLQYHPYQARRPSQASVWSHGAFPGPASPYFDVERKGRCPECGRIFKDLKAHMLTHQSERPEKCPIPTCEYHTKGFARKYDRCRHTLTHYKGTMVCDFCPGGGSAAEKSFNRADVFKRHLTSVHGVEQNPPNSRRKNSGATAKKGNSSLQETTTGKCSTCSAIFNNAQDLYDHLDDCVLKSLEQAEPSEAINAQHLSEVAGDDDVRQTLERHMLPVELDTTAGEAMDEEDEEDSAEEGDSSAPTSQPSGAAGNGMSRTGNEGGL